MPDFVLDHEPAGFARIKVVGVGGGGCNAVDSMFDIGLQNVEFYVINSDLQALKRSKCPNRIQIGAKMTQGRGCGADPRLGENCMLDAREEIIETLRGADIVFVTAGLGGGTGTGAAPVVAQIAKELGILTVCVVTKPFKFEGARRSKSAESGLEKLRDACDTMIVINNERLLDVVGPKVPMKEAFKIADNVVAQAVSSISDLIATPGLINVDFNDVRTIMGGRGGAVMGVGVGKGENRAAEAVKKATSSPLLDKIVIDGATGVLICITGGPDMTLMEVNEATQMVHEVADPDAEIIFGAVIDESMTDTLRVTIIATGFADDVQRKQMQGEQFELAPQVAQIQLPTQMSRMQRHAPPVAQAPVAPARQAPAPWSPAPVMNYAKETTNGTNHNHISNPSLDLPMFNEMPEVAPAPVAPAPVAAYIPAPLAVAAPTVPDGSRPAPVRQPDSLRATLERMMTEQGQANGGTTAQPPIRVAKSNPAPAAPAPVAHPSGVRTASAPRAESTRPATEEHAPQVSLFDPAAGQQLTEEKGAELDTPAFLRRRRSLFE